MNHRKISKFISLLLRHKPETIGLTLDAQGWASVDALIEKMNAHGRAIDLDVLKKVVETNDKQRFSFSEDGLYIKANQGHSIKIDLALEPSIPPDVLYHGTATRFLNSIFQEGLTKQKRHHVHLSPDLNTASKVGSRHGKLAILFVDAKAMHEAGHEFFVSKNGVWLTDAVPVQYLSQKS